MNGIEAGNWRNSVMSVYQAALGTDSEEFTKHGSQEECDHEVLEACKKAEMSLSVGGSGKASIIVMASHCFAVISSKPESIIACKRLAQIKIFT